MWESSDIYIVKSLLVLFFIVVIWILGRRGGVLKGVDLIEFWYFIIAFYIEFGIVWGSGE